MRKYFKRFISFFLIPVTQWYLRKERSFSYQDIKVVVKPGVFHPGIFYSTKFLLHFLAKQNLKDQTVLELGCGTGIISIVAAKAGALVTASDLNVHAVENAKRNAALNKVDVEIIHSDLFENLRERKFQWIIINPPYYAANPQSDEELAWKCGEDFDYFRKLFSTLKNHIEESTQVIMVLTKGCDLQSIFSIAGSSGFVFELVAEQNVLFDEKDFLYRITKKT